MYCPKCGSEIPDNSKECPNCDWKEESVESQETIKTEDVENNVPLSELAIENLDIEPSNSENFELEEQEAEVKPEDIIVDFDEINNNESKPNKKVHVWPAAVISFIAGVLVTLLTIGCFNGTIMNYFDKMTQGVPDDVIKDYYTAFYNTKDSKALTKTLSPYLRAQMLSSLQSYNYVDSKLEIDVSDDSKFKDVVDTYFKVFDAQSTYTTHPVIDKVEVTNTKYYKSGSDKYTEYLNTFKGEYSNVKNVSLFADVTFNLSYHVEQNETTVAPSTTAASTKAGKTAAENKTTTTKTSTTTATTTKAEATTAEKYNQVWKGSCVKIGDSWYIFETPQQAQ